MTTRALRAVLSILGVIVFVRFALPGVILGVAWTGDGEVVPTSLLDGETRFLACLAGGVGFLLFWLARNFERSPGLFHAAMIATFLGGLSRFLSIAQFGMPSSKGTLPIFIELGFPVVAWILFLSRGSQLRQPSAPG